jgi:hypothetical protein
MSNNKYYFPYYFIKRHCYTTKRKADAFHDKLNKGHLDIAFEITWTALTPLALNPCDDNSREPTMPPINEDQYKGFNHTWLYINRRPVISGFTVKSAIANAYANLVGGCYRVNDRVEGHTTYQKGVYIYPGAYKRYRVARESSKPGIILEIKETDEGKYVRIQPVKEYYMDSKTDIELQKDKYYDVKIIEKRGHKPPIIEIAKPPKDTIKVQYYGPYSYGKDLKVGKHKYRFYKKDGKPVEGIVKKENFYDIEELKKIVSIGGADSNDNPVEWYQNLNDIKEGDFVYYELFNGRVQHIGKNFLFKALFFHPDTIPENSKTCNTLESLCPRCQLFGFVFKEENQESTGFKGRFKASNLVAEVEVVPEKTDSHVPVIRNNHTHNQKVSCFRLINKNGEEIGRQFLLPIQGPPKPNKRDIDGYYDKNTGELKGAKTYLHTDLKGEKLEEHIKKLIKDDDKKDGPYSHGLRSWAEVLYEGITFKGTVGAENCSIDEVANLVFILSTDYSGNAFKLGLGKAFGLGSVGSRITAIWVRKPDDYKWIRYPVTNIEDIFKALPETKSLLENLKKSNEILSRLNLKTEEFRELRYPEKGYEYWKEFNNKIFCP